MTRIECTLHGSLEDSMPAYISGNKITLDFDAPPSVNALLARLKLDPEYLQYALTQGTYIDIDNWNQPIESNEIQLWPRISGG